MEQLPTLHVFCLGLSCICAPRLRQPAEKKTPHGNKNIQENLAKEFKSSTLGVESAKSSHISQDWLFNPIQTGGGGGLTPPKA